MAGPVRTVLAGGVLIVAAMLTATAVTFLTVPSVVRVIVYVVAVGVAVVGAAMTLRDGP